jgi:hypothetical protein
VAGGILAPEWSVIALPQQDETGLSRDLLPAASLLHARRFQTLPISPNLFIARDFP